MFHSIGLEKHPWAWNHISEPVATFEAKIARLESLTLSHLKLD